MASLLNATFSLPQIVSKKSSCTALAYKVEEKKYRMLVINPTHVYCLAKIKLPFDIEKVTISNKSNNHFVAWQGKCFTEKVCPRGASIVDIIKK